MSILVVEIDFETRSQLRQTLASLGFGSIVEAPDHSLALEKMRQRKVTHILFDARKTNMPSHEFLVKAMQMQPETIAIPSSFEPTVDDVFNLLTTGARGYLVKPFTQGSVDDSIIQATKGEPISESILHAKDRNSALAALVLTSLDRLATVMRQAEQFETAKQEIPIRSAGLRRAVDIARVFSEGGNAELLDAVVEACVERAQGPASRLGRVRKRLEDKKIKLGETAPSQQSAETPEVSNSTTKNTP